MHVGGVYFAIKTVNNNLGLWSISKREHLFDVQGSSEACYDRSCEMDVEHHDVREAYDL